MHRVARSNPSTSTSLSTKQAAIHTQLMVSGHSFTAVSETNRVVSFTTLHDPYMGHAGGTRALQVIPSTVDSSLVIEGTPKCGSTLKQARRTMLLDCVIHFTKEHEGLEMDVNGIDGVHTVYGYSSGRSRGSTIVISVQTTFACGENSTLEAMDMVEALHLIVDTCSAKPTSLTGSGVLFDRCVTYTINIFF